MPVLMSCPRGHQWEDLFDDQMSLQDGHGRCPVCGIAIDAPPAPPVPEVPLPGRRVQPNESTRVSDPKQSTGTITRAGKGSANLTQSSSEIDLPKDDSANGTWPLAEDQMPEGFKGPDIPGYEILTELGRGGMGVVYLARQTALDRFVAVKMVIGGGYAAKARRRRFRLEAQAVARLHHPNVVQIYDIGEHEDHPYFTLEYVDGGSLCDRFSKPLPPEEAAHVLETLARAMHCAHERGIVHRDLKPSNILLARDGTPKITDFGLAKVADAEDAHTRTGSVLGTPSYMAPEQAAGNKNIGPPADIYALGSILYEALTGRPPFKSDNSIDLLWQLANADPKPPSFYRPGIPRDLETICLKCLEKQPRKRYAGARDLADDLQRFLVHEPILARPATSWERTVKWIRRHPTTSALAGSVAAAGLGFLILMGIQAAGRARTERMRLENARAELRDSLVRAEIAAKDESWEAAEQLYAGARNKIESEPDLAEPDGEARDRLQFVGGRLSAHRTLQEFSQKRDEALFHATLSNGEGSGGGLRTARDKAREALAIVGMALEGDEPWSLNDGFADAEKAEVREKCYELVLVLADAESQTTPGQSEAEQQRRAADALRILDRAPTLGLQTKAYHMRRARLLEMNGGKDDAAAEAAKGERLPSQTALDHYLLGDELYRRGTPEAAEAEFQATLRTRADHFWARYFLALCYMRLNKLEPAREDLTGCLREHPDIVWIYLMRGFTCGRLKEYASAEADFGEALRLLEKNPDEDARYVLYNNRAIVRVGQTDYDGAVADLQQAIELRPNQYPAYASLAQTLYLLKRPDEAVTRLGEAIKAAEPLVRSQEVEPTTLALLYRTRARFQRERKDDDAALADLDLAVAASPEGSLVLAQAQIERGQLLTQSGRLDEARAACEAAAIARPGLAAAHRGVGEVLFRMKNYADAIQAFTDYLKIENNPPAAVYQARALAHMRLGDPWAALDDFTLAIDKKPNDAVLLTQRGQAFLACQNEQYKAALKDFEEAIRCNPNNGPAYSGRAHVQLELGRIAEAMADADRALQLGPRNASVLYGVSALYARAVAKLDADTERKKSSDSETRLRCLERAVGLLAEAMQLLPEDQRTVFWRDKVQRDGSFTAVRHSIEFARIHRRFAGAAAQPHPSTTNRNIPPSPTRQ